MIIYLNQRDAIDNEISGAAYKKMMSGLNALRYYEVGEKKVLLMKESIADIIQVQRNDGFTLDMVCSEYCYYHQEYKEQFTFESKDYVFHFFYFANTDEVCGELHKKTKTSFDLLKEKIEQEIHAITFNQESLESSEQLTELHAAEMKGSLYSLELVLKEIEHLLKEGI